MSKKEKLKLLKELEERIGNLRAHVFYGYAMTGQDQNIQKIKLLVSEIDGVLLTDHVKKSQP